MIKFTDKKDQVHISYNTEVIAINPFAFRIVFTFGQWVTGSPYAV